ncbi:MAG: hypothetical protein A2293_16910 [Elusimicrobia bacterium RIFOXYB2_FULL_49_7]|nr:MAG: hypothetical protein A2293_16910 [Elusimicrobia bacterium RIFOXYB2_FULL_49_7]
MFLIKVKIKSFLNSLKKMTLGGFIKLALGVLLGLSFLWLLYLGFYRLFAYVQGIQIIGSLLLLKFLGIAFFTSFLMVILSAVISSFSTIFFSSDLNLLLTMPVKPWKVFLVKSLETAFQSSWMMVVTLIPFLAAYAAVKNTGAGFFAVFALLGVPFFFISAACGILISMGIMFLFPSSKSRDIILFIAIFFGSLAYVLFRFVEPERLANPDAFYDAVGYLAYLNAPVARLLPSWWFTESLNAITISNNRLLLNDALLLTGAALGLLFILLALAEKFYYPIVTSVHLGVEKKKTGRNAPLKISRLNFLMKDVKVFFRDTKQWSQVLLVAALVLVYLFSIQKLPKSFSGGNYPSVYISNFLAFFNIGAAGFILASLALRFVFVQISLEKGNLWLVFSAPVSIEKFFARKFIVSAVPMLFLGLVMGIFSNLLLKVSSPAVFWFSSCTIILLSVGLLCMALGLGAVYPKFDSDNIAEIEASYGGIFYMVCALVYIGLTMGIEAVPMQLLIKHQLGLQGLHLSDLAWHAVDLFILNAIVIGLPLWRGIRSLKKYEMREWSY